MASIDFSKRELLRWTTLTLVGLLAGSRAYGQNNKLFGIKIPEVVMDIIPGEPLNIARTVETVLRLERQADLKHLPRSILSRNSGQPIIASENSLYQLALPRLVALIDRSELSAWGLADQAGALLAELHASQHEIPEALRLQQSDTAALSSGTNLPLLGIVPATQQPPAAEIIKVQNIPAPVAPVINSASPAPPRVPPLDGPESDQELSRNRDYSSLQGEYARMFKSLELRSEYAEPADWHLTMIRKSRRRYENVGQSTGVPWHFIAVIHALESSFNFRAHLHNGDFPLTARTRQVPSGRPATWLPPADWESSARDALRLLGFTGQKDWSLERTLYRLETYNGLGYRKLGVPTPYLWSFSNHYERGKFVADGRWSATARSQQCGTAVMLKLLVDAGEINIANTS